MNRSKVALLSSLGGVATLVSQSAMAALPAEATALFTSVAADGALVIGAAFVAATALVGGWIVFDMVKKGARKAAR